MAFSIMAVNLGTRGVQEALDLVEYLRSLDRTYPILPSVASTNE